MHPIELHFSFVSFQFARLQELTSSRQSDRQTMQQTDRKLIEERRQRQSLETQLNNERKQRKLVEEKLSRYVIAQVVSNLNLPEFSILI